MKILLVNPNSETVESSRRFRREMLTPIVPLGIAYIAAVLEEDGIEVKIFDQVAEKISTDILFERIVSERPQIIGFSCLTATMNNVIRLVQRIRAYDERTRIVLGNIHASLFADELLKQGVGDIVVHGEGEFAMKEIAASLCNGGDLSRIKGISFNDYGKVRHNAARDPIEELDKLPYPAIHLLKMEKYVEVPLASIYNSRASVIQGSRGCPFKCIFCTQDKIHKRPRYRRIESIVDEIEYMVERYKIKHIGFADPFFPFSVKSGLEFCDRFIARGLHKKVRWVTETRVDLVNLELLKRMKEAGAHLIMYGFEVGNQSVLDHLKKGTTLQQAREAMRHTRKAGILTLGLFMLGLPGETRETCEDTIRFAKELDCDFIKFNVTVPYPGSELFYSHMARKTTPGEFDKFTSWYDWYSDSGDLLYMPEGMSSAELKGLQRKAMFSYYMRPKIVLRNLIKRRISLKFLFYGACILMNAGLKVLFNKIKTKTG